MVKKFLHFRTKIGGTIGSILSGVGAGGGTTTAVCQTTCSISPAAASFFGASLAFAPLVFLFKYHILLWWVAFIFLSLLIIVYISQVKKSKLDQILITLNTGFLIMGFPYFAIDEKIFLFSGGIIAFAGLVLFIFYLLTKNKIKHS